MVPTKRYPLQVFSPVPKQQMKLEASKHFEKWQGMTALEIAKQSENRDVITVLSNNPSDDRNKVQEGRF